MTRVPQPPGRKGSLKWIQRSVAIAGSELDQAITASIPNARTIEWLSPRANDDYAEYRDGAFLDRLGLAQMRPALAAFWPEKGPQWDALGKTDTGDILLVEAKAHIGEFCSPASGASPSSLSQIKAAFAQSAKILNVREQDAERWTDRFYQYANRLAHLALLRRENIPAWLVFVGFCDDVEMSGGTTAAGWRAAYQVADYALGLPRRHALSRYIIHAYPSVEQLQQEQT